MSTHPLLARALAQAVRDRTPTTPPAVAPVAASSTMRALASRLAFAALRVPRPPLAREAC